MIPAAFWYIHIDFYLYYESWISKIKPNYLHLRQFLSCPYFIHFRLFYSDFKLKQQEICNVVWIRPTSTTTYQSSQQQINRETNQNALIRKKSIKEFLAVARPQPAEMTAR